MSERIKLCRTRGWRLPLGAVSVARPGRFGNPYTVAGAIENGYATTTGQARKVAVEFYRAWLLGLESGDQDRYVTGKHTYDRLWMREHLPDLAGRTLACWCPLDGPCHADVLAAIVTGRDEAGRTLMATLHPDFPLPRW